MAKSGIKSIVSANVDKKALNAFANKKMYEGAVPLKFGFEIDLQEYMKTSGLSQEKTYEKIMAIARNCAKGAFKKDIEPSISANNAGTNFCFFSAGNAASLKVVVNADGKNVQVQTYLLDGKYIKQIRDLLQA